MSFAEGAMLFAIGAHGANNQVRKYTGEPYWIHLQEVASLVKQHGGSEAAVAAAWLHDVREDTSITSATIELLFGETVARLVDGVTDISKLEDGTRAVRKRLDREHLARQCDVCKTIKLCDVISNTKTIHQLDPEFARIYLKEKLSLLDALRGGNQELWLQAYLQVSSHLEEIALTDSAEPAQRAASA
ncbi:HD domain-containing protein (plasmid) [Halopseudomonas sp. SMJS2]|uniref:HD domain-containing protein n=1 Tax=Halopseudomonas sp. SMJS2 TaxID=3041098 RepID=UPI0024536AC9|nr:HD domain-containing protein [Halopseudomonas sp. SMJS2]WGK63547.1 HD domain-containing protein [Halopseudomonas sp. SMJS2]